MNNTKGIVQSSKTPKKLSVQAADRFAHFVMKQMWDVIESITDKNLDLDVQANNLGYLKRMKLWFWEEATWSLGHKNSQVRKILGESFMDVLDWKNKYRKCRFLHRFLIQLLFCFKAGNLEHWTNMREYRQPSDRLRRLINGLGPFRIKEIHDSCLSFENVDVLRTLLSHSPDLEKIQLRHNLSGAIRLLYHYCRNVKILIIDVENVYNEDFYLLFNTLSQILLGTAGNHIKLKNIPFNSLSEVCIRYDRLPKDRSIMQIMANLQCCHPSIRTIQTCLLALPFDTLERKFPFACPTLAVKKDVENQQFSMFLGDETTSKSILKLENPDEARRNMSTMTEQFGTSILEVQQDISLMQSLHSLRYIYCYEGKAYVSSTGVLPNSISELYVFGPLQTNEDVLNLQEVLNSCPKLEVLRLQVRINCLPDMRRLKLMRKLQTLSFSLGKFTPFNMFEIYVGPPPPLQDHIDYFLISLIAAAPNILALEIPGSCNLQALSGLKHVSGITLLSLTDGNVRQVIPFIRSLPSLEKVTLDRDFGYKKFLKIKKTLKTTELSVTFRRARLVSPVTHVGLLERV